VKSLLYALPCFNHVEKISTVSSGLSQSCFKVFADNKIYFAKTISNNTEVLVAKSAGYSDLGPTVIYHDDSWLVSEFIETRNLALSTLNTENKIDQTIKLMTRCHQLNMNTLPDQLNPKALIYSLIDKPHYSAIQQTALLAFSQLILTPLENTKQGVCCHGDLNFTNVLMDEVQSTSWLIDYECACTAPIEFDIAMFIAVNNLNNKVKKITIEQYENQSSVKVDQLLLNHYLLFSYLINALWYFNVSHEKTQNEDKKALLKHAEAQWYALHSSLKITDSPLLNSLSIKLTNVLTTLDFSNQT
jgi:thiamine kinase-like enzyme